MSVAVTLANAIVNRLNSVTFSQRFTATRRIVPFMKPDDAALHSVQVYVLANTRKAERRTRHDFARMYKPIVVVQKRLTAGADEAIETDEVDDLQTLVEEIEEALEDEDYIANQLPPALQLSFVGFDEEQDRDAYGLEAMKDHRVFATAITLEYTT